jgi:hypothetical protein
MRIPCRLSPRPTTVGLGDRGSLTARQAPAVAVATDEHVRVPAGHGERRACERAGHRGATDDDRRLAEQPRRALDEVEPLEHERAVAEGGDEGCTVAHRAAADVDEEEACVEVLLGQGGVARAESAEEPVFGVLDLGDGDGVLHGRFLSLVRALAGETAGRGHDPPSPCPG